MAKLEIPPPRADRQPLRANLLNSMQKAGMQLVPLFPYMHAGAMVPAGSLFIGGPEADYGHFFHGNTVDEVIVAFVTDGGTLKTGQLYVGGRSHGVNSFLKNEHQPGSFAVFSITQRQVEQGEQTESMGVRCEQCREMIYEYEFDASSPADTPVADEVEYPFKAHRGSIDAMSRYNADEQHRTCSGCGHVNRVFPIEGWRWDRYATQSELMLQAKRRLHEAAAAATRKAAEAAQKVGAQKVGTRKAGS